jgi:hypothetical protein
MQYVSMLASRDTAYCAQECEIAKDPQKQETATKVKKRVAVGKKKADEFEQFDDEIKRCSSSIKDGSENFDVGCNAGIAACRGGGEGNTDNLYDITRCRSWYASTSSSEAPIPAAASSVKPEQYNTWMMMHWMTSASNLQTKRPENHEDGQDRKILPALSRARSVGESVPHNASRKATFARQTRINSDTAFEMDGACNENVGTAAMKRALLDPLSLHASSWNPSAAKRSLLDPLSFNSSRHSGSTNVAAAPLYRNEDGSISWSEKASWSEKMEVLVGLVKDERDESSRPPTRQITRPSLRQISKSDEYPLRQHRKGQQIRKANVPMHSMSRCQSSGGLIEGFSRSTSDAAQNERLCVVSDDEEQVRENEDNSNSNNDKYAEFNTNAAILARNDWRTIDKEHADGGRSTRRALQLPALRSRPHPFPLIDKEVLSESGDRPQNQPELPSRTLTQEDILKLYDELTGLIGMRIIKIGQRQVGEMTPYQLKHGNERLPPRFFAERA